MVKIPRKKVKLSKLLWAMDNFNSNFSEYCDDAFGFPIHHLLRMLYVVCFSVNYSLFILFSWICTQQIFSVNSHFDSFVNELYRWVQHIFGCHEHWRQSTIFLFQLKWWKIFPFALYLFSCEGSFVWHEISFFSLFFRF